MNQVLTVLDCGGAVGYLLPRLIFKIIYYPQLNHSKQGVGSTSGGGIKNYDLTVSQLQKVHWVFSATVDF